MADMVTCPLAFAFGIGRIGNLINGELAGKPTGGDWGMIYPHIDNIPRHVPPFYELMGYLVIVAILHYLFVTWKTRPTGLIFPFSVMSAAAWRYVVEFYKVSPLDVGMFTSGQILCIFLFLSGIAIILWLLNDPIRIKLDKS